MVNVSVLGRKQRKCKSYVVTCLAEQNKSYNNNNNNNHNNNNNNNNNNTNNTNNNNDNNNSPFIIKEKV